MADKDRPVTVNMGLKLFPPTPKDKGTVNPTRKPSTRRHAGPSQQDPVALVEELIAGAGPSGGRQSALDGRQSSMGGRQTPQPQPQIQMSSGRQTPPSQPSTQTQTQTGRQTPQTQLSQSEYGSPITSPPQAYFALDPPPRSHTSFSEAPTLVRSNSNASHTSHHQPHPKNASPPREREREEPVMRSIFPRYNPDVPLEHQAYFPTQQSPTHIPKTIINRRPYSPGVGGRSPLQSPAATVASPGRFPRGLQDESIMEPSTNNELKEFWKVVNGWKVSNSEGRRFCLNMTSGVDEPVHTLSSATQPFYTLKLIPTSTSAQMTLLRFDPNKTPKSANSKLGMSSKPKEGSEVMLTTMEETARRLPPNDGLVALLYPKAASDLVIDLANKPPRADAETIIASAERECGRLVWDEDSGKYYLVHPALSTPFIVSITSSPAWSRVEYTLEHPELPRNLVRLVRDGAGAGYLEVDTAVAARIDCFYIVDVAICATMLVALAEEKKNNIERFDAPPSIAPISPPTTPRKTTPRRQSSTWTRTKSKYRKDKEIKMEEFEMDQMDLESQVSVKDNKKEKQKDEKVPGCFGLIWMLLKFFVWAISASFKLAAKIIIFLSKCLSKNKQ